MSSFLFLLTLAAAALATGSTIGPHGTLHLTNMDISPDGFKRAASVINGVTPGPIIMIEKGDRVRMNVVNQLSDPNQHRGASIHWHGMLQKGTNFMDGTSGVNQCPITPNDSFLYDFPVEQSGTYWYHSHFGVQYCDGIRGALIIKDPKDPLRFLYDVDDESTVITLSEWYHESAKSLRSTIAEADSTLINGKGRYVGGPKAELSVVNIHHGKRYRLRLVSMSCEPNFVFSIDNHDLTIIEVDGVVVLPYKVNAIQMFTGQRYSAVLEANQRPNNYWIRARPNFGRGNLTSTFEGGVNSAILRYKGAHNAEPKSRQQEKQDLLKETNLHPLFDLLAPGKPTPDGADVTFDLDFSFDPAQFKFLINNKSFVSPDVPVLLQILSGARNAHELLPEGSVYTVERGKTVQVNMPSNLIGGPHPFHLHGHTFSVVRSADSGHFNFFNPPKRDVVNTGMAEGDFVSIRFRTDNPGPWILHCHVDFHLDLGLAIVFAEAPDQTVAANKNVTDDWKQLCPQWNAFSNATGPDL
ncbi:hypothetical protein AGABI1DRAFT_132563 [Agaricus bisporus var. burnettii JB137-S8]|uniref:Laccase n=1 Tax=Agaricus bisporus var. burnettii (strain JB137-S8 / ATCC MYA-4627 / FGSC 10392) TaxID=597362 RepID=K5WWF2_AGABU|nr:uncharacterized protein AGABI1DRAFT_132563 [Agaricus bisporus var. burnettii JB137-S8]EKM75113.1 hypothetical protein AGABI1DRAFT_132563 [Agaricus bisporus var. burnettii JB137-S8]